MYDPSDLTTYDILSICESRAALNKTLTAALKLTGDIHITEHDGHWVVKIPTGDFPKSP